MRWPRLPTSTITSINQALAMAARRSNKIKEAVAGAVRVAIAYNESARKLRGERQIAMSSMYSHLAQGIMVAVNHINDYYANNSNRLITHGDINR